MVLWAGCATVPRPACVVLSSPWHGRTINELIQVQGLPERSMSLPDGTSAYEYRGRSVTATSSPYAWGSTTLHERTCRLTFFATAEGVITSSRWDGNACPCQ